MKLLGFVAIATLSIGEQFLKQTSISKLYQPAEDLRGHLVRDDHKETVHFSNTADFDHVKAAVSANLNPNFPDIHKKLLDIVLKRLPQTGQPDTLANFFSSQSTQTAFWSWQEKTGETFGDVTYQRGQGGIVTMDIHQRHDRAAGGGK